MKENDRKNSFTNLTQSIDVQPGDISLPQHERKKSVSDIDSLTDNHLNEKKRLNSIDDTNLVVKVEPQTSHQSDSSSTVRKHSTSKSATNQRFTSAIKKNPISTGSLMSTLQKKSLRRTSHSALTTQTPINEEITENKENNESIVNQEKKFNMNRLRSAFYGESKSWDPNDYNLDLTETERAKQLFEYIYGFKGLPRLQLRTSAFSKPPLPPLSSTFSNTSHPLPEPPLKERKTISSSNYFNPDNSIKDTVTTNEDEHFYASEYMQRLFTDQERPVSRNFTFENPYLFEWLSLHEKKSKLMHDRLDRAREKNTNIEKENKRLWSAAIERKRSAVSAFSEQKQQRRLPMPMSAGSTSTSDRSVSSQLNKRPNTSNTNTNTNNKSPNTVKKNKKLEKLNNRETKSAYEPFIEKSQIVELSKRPKSVSFALNQSKTKSTEEGKKSVETKPIIRLKNTTPSGDTQTYLVSQIEMEEILKEAEKKFIEQKTALSSRKQSKTSGELELYNNSHRTVVNSYGDFPTRIETDDGEDDDQEFDEISDFFNRQQRKPRSSSKTGPTSAGFSTNTTVDDELKTDHRLKKLRKKMHSERQKSANWDFSDSNEDELASDCETKQHSSQSAIKLPLHRLRTPCSIPSKHQKYVLVEMPQIHLEYSLPDKKEKCLLPIRFPILYGKIITSLTKVDLALLNAKRVNSATVATVDIA